MDSRSFHPFGPLGELDQILIGCGVLHHQLGLTAHGQHDGVHGFFQLAEELGGVPPVKPKGAADAPRLARLQLGADDEAP